jgi:hypothetical protein
VDVQATTTKGRYRDALRIGEFRAFFAAYLVSFLGDVVAAVALTVLVYRRSGSPFLAALTFTVAFVPYVFGAGLLSGLTDRLPPRRLIVASDVVSAAIVATMAAPGVPVAGLLALLFAANLLRPVAMGARNALLVEILPGPAYVPGRSLFRLVAQGGQVVGNALGGLLLALIAPRTAFLLDAAGFLASAAVVRLAVGHRPALGRSDGRSLIHDSLAGVRTILGHPALRRVMLFQWLVPTCSVAPEALAAPSVAALHAGPAAVGWWLAAIPAGTVLGEVAGVWLLSQDRQRRLIRPFAACVFVPLLAFAASPPLGVALALLVASGLAGAYFLGLDRLLVDVTPPPLLARMYATSTAGLVSLQGLGFAAAGALAEVVPPHVAIVGAGIAGLVVVAALRLPQPRE